MEKKFWHFDICDKFTEWLLVIGWFLVVVGAVFLLMELYPIAREIWRMIQEGYVIVHGEVLPPRN